MRSDEINAGEKLLLPMLAESIKTAVAQAGTHEGEKLPLALFELWVFNCVLASPPTTKEDDLLIKKGMELCAAALLPLLAQCVPCVDAVERDTRITRDDAGLLTLLAQIRQLT